MVHPVTGGTSRGQKRDWRVYDFVARGDVLSAFLHPPSISLRLYRKTLHYGILLQECYEVSKKLFLFENIDVL